METVAQMGRRFIDRADYSGIDRREYWMHGIGMAVSAAIFVLLIVLSYKLIKNWLANKTTPANALEIAKARFAKGEITKEELKEIKKELAD